MTEQDLKSVIKLNKGIYSLLSRLSTARGSGTSLVTVSPAKVRACNTILFTEGIPEVKIRKEIKSVNK